MKKHPRHPGYTGLARMIASNNKKEQVNSKPNSSEKTSLVISIIAIGISLLSLYFQFFYEKYYLIANVIDGTFENDSTLITKVVYHNKGNQHSTIVQNTIYFYQDSTDIEAKGFYFSATKPEITRRDDYDPVVLTPGQQVYRDIIQPIDFQSLDYPSLNIDPSRQIKMAIKFGFVKDNGFIAVNIIPIGWLKLDSSLAVKYWNIDFATQHLESDTFYTARHLKPKDAN
ncbi:hypothetical protein FAM09_12310 [Niastella caeni]|uniref:Uncharacterized protein n=1 Tax=Niastella caeni TaxID=2569763 RepID=A0A4S8HX00_9BACT|nr:hypothetical protein [Niastella caeni]THU39289.1 hypothetical protein FAM09_12310 [Niastella caeni]